MEQVCVPRKRTREPLKFKKLIVYVSTLVDMWQEQRSPHVSNYPHPKAKAVKDLTKDVKLRGYRADPGNF